MSPAAPVTRRVLAPGLLLVLAGVAIVVIATSANWRLALLAAVVAALVAASRLRFAAPAALVLLAVVALLAATGRTAGTDRRPIARAAVTATHHSVAPAARPRHADRRSQ